MSPQVRQRTEGKLYEVLRIPYDSKWVNLLLTSSKRWRYGILSFGIICALTSNIGAQEVPSGAFISSIAIIITFSVCLDQEDRYSRFCVLHSQRGFANSLSQLLLQILFLNRCPLAVRFAVRAVVFGAHRAKHSWLLSF